jgi:hypothetical protein
MDVIAEVDIAAEPTDVAGVMFDPQREPEWMTVVSSVELVDPGLAIGARVKHRGRALGFDIEWTTAVEAFHFPHLLRLRVTEGPFTGTIEYGIQRSAGGSRARIRNAGEPTGLGFVPASLVENQVRTALQNDLARLKQLVES